MKANQSNNSVYDTTIRLLVLLLLVVWCLLIMAPFATIILWSLILTFAMQPLHTSLTKKFGGRPKVASSILIGAMALIIILPVGVLVTTLIGEVKELKALYMEGKLTIPPPNESVQGWPLIGKKLYPAWQEASTNLEQAVVKYQDQLTTVVKTVGKGILGSAGAMLQIIIAFIIAGILLLFPGVEESIRMFFRKLAGDRGDEFADTAVKTIGSVLKGIIGVALILALMHGIVFLLAGIPFAGVWTLLVFILCVLQIPVIFVTLPIIIYLFAENGLTTALIWTVILFVIGLSDNVLKPLLLGKGAPVPMLVIFIGVIGGFIFSGFIGLFTGAIVLSLGYKLFISWLDSSEKMKSE